MTKLKVLDLFSGIGGFSLGLERTGGFETVAFCEIEEFPRKVLKKHWPEIRCFEDVRKLKGSDVGAVDLICGGYPCQPFSTAGKRRGEKDDRHLWPEFNRLVAELRPSWVIGENVAGHISMGLDDVLSDLEGQGYACRTFVIPACAVGAHHRRDRCWTVAHSGDVLQPRKLDTRTNCRTSSGSEGRDDPEGQAPYGKRVRTEPGSSASVLAHTSSERQSETGTFSTRRSKRLAGSSIASANVADTDSVNAQGSTNAQSTERSWPWVDEFSSRRDADKHPGRIWLTEPNVGRVAHGVPDRVDRLKGCGNAVVPQIPEMIGHAILEAERAA